MKHISILIPKGDSSFVNIIGSYRILVTAMEQYKAVYGKALFEIDLVGFDFDKQTYNDAKASVPSFACVALQLIQSYTCFSQRISHCM